MRTVHVGVGQAAWGGHDGKLSTSGLGSCIAVAIYDRVSRLGGLIHYQLPYETDPERGRTQPFLFCTPGLPVFSRLLGAHGCIPARSTVAIAGGAQIVAEVAQAAIGPLNAEAARRALHELGYAITREHIGGRLSRSVVLDLSTGNVTVHQRGIQ
jgi:chemotaxis protein CheD